MSLVTDIVNKVAAEKIAKDAKTRAERAAKEQKDRDFIETAIGQLAPIHEAVLVKAKRDLETLGYSAQESFSDHTTHLTASLVFCPISGDRPVNFQGHIENNIWAAQNAVEFLVRIDRPVGETQEVTISWSCRDNGNGNRKTIKLFLNQLWTNTVEEHLATFLLGALRAADGLDAE